MRHEYFIPCAPGLEPILFGEVKALKLPRAEQQVGGVRVKLNDFNYRGTGLPFVPYTPTDFTKKRQGLY